MATSSIGAVNDARAVAGAQTSKSIRQRAALALFLIAPAPSIGVLVGLTFQKGALGIILWAGAKVWLFGLPVAWRLLIDKEPLSWSLPRHGGLAIGALSGGFIGFLIAAIYYLVVRDAIDPSLVKNKIGPLGLTQPVTFLALAAYIVFINSALEEYVYRWFVFRKWEKLVGGTLAVVGSALIFVVHHTIILAAYFPDWIVVLGSIGVFIGGMLWSLLYLKYRSIWPPYLSHALVDVAVLAVGYEIILSAG